MIAESSKKDSQKLLHSGRARRIQDKLTVFFFLVPGLVIFLVFVTYPIFQSIFYSLFDWNGLGPLEDYLALDNYIRILSDKIFILAVRNGFLIVGLSLFVRFLRS
jgi:raffinose/stachyose/melibiose transport system permease protein